VALVGEIVPAAIGCDPRVLDRATGGRTRGAAVRLADAVWADPRHADRVLSRGLREARELHSAERRLVSDGLYALIRHHRWFSAATGTGDRGTWWDAWIAIQAGGTPASVPVPADPVDALALFGSLDRAFAAALLAEHPDPVGFVAASNTRAPLALRADPRLGRAEVARRLAAEGVATHDGHEPDALIVDGSANLLATAVFRDGHVEVQDEGSQRAGAVACGPGVVIDLCAGAGGKALQLAASGATVIACDPRSNALAELDKRARRARLPVRTVLLDGRERLEAADRVLVDAPCTGSGTLRRHPELRFRIDGDAIARLATEHAAILDRAAGLVKPGGMLVDVTCSVLRDEGERVIEGFVARNPGFETVGGWSTSPEIGGADGFFACALRRT
jgi:16S rRNA (cytosine967-C5)-methyltransferase